MKYAELGQGKLTYNPPDLLMLSHSLKVWATKIPTTYTLQNNSDIITI